MTESALTGASDWASCHCCGKYYLAINMVRFEHHPDDALCVTCVAWLYDRSKPIFRKLYPIWELPARIRARRTSGAGVTHANGQAPEGSALCQVSTSAGHRRPRGSQRRPVSYRLPAAAHIQQAGRRRVIGDQHSPMLVSQQSPLLVGPCLPSREVEH